jgi:hypothetical protein
MRTTMASPAFAATVDIEVPDRERSRMQGYWSADLLVPGVTVTALPVLARVSR